MVMKNADREAEQREREDAERAERVRRNQPGAGAEIDTRAVPGGAHAAAVQNLRVRLDRLKHYVPTTARYEFSQIADDVERLLGEFVPPGSLLPEASVSYGRLSVGETVTEENADAERGEREKAQLNAREAAERAKRDRERAEQARSGVPTDTQTEAEKRA